MIWAMRERLISVAISREPRPPAFRVPQHHPAPPPSEPLAVADDATPAITEVSGIGPVYATRLGSHGLSTLADLADASPEKVAAAAQVGIGRAEGWIEAARSLIGEGQTPRSS